MFDPTGNRVKGKTITFSLSDNTGGTLSSASAVTNEYGEAVVTYTAGPVSSANNGVQITASVQGTALQKVVGLSVSQQLFVTLGTGNLIQKPDSTRYKQPYNVLVTTGTGAPVANATVTLSIIPTFYSKGYYTWSDTATLWIPTYTTVPPCPNEDFHFGPNDGRSGNGILDPGEDQNGNNKLEPGNVVTLENPQGGTGTSVTITTSSTAGNEGFGFFNVVYAQQFANWVSVALTARTTVAGSEAMDVADYMLPILADDVTKKTTSPPGDPSPFGTIGSCYMVDGILTANPLVLTGTGPVTLTLLRLPQKTPVQDELVTGTVISNSNPVTTTKPNGLVVKFVPNPVQTDVNGKATSTVTISGGQSGDTAVIEYTTLGVVTATVSISIP